MRVKVKMSETEDVVLDIIFRKANLGERRKKNKKELIDTACMIFRDGIEIAFAIAIQNPLDAYNKIVGKKVALRKAIDKVGFLKDFPVYKQRRLEQRRHIWNVFYQTFGRWN